MVRASSMRREQQLHFLANRVILPHFSHLQGLLQAFRLINQRKISWPFVFERKTNFQRRCL